MNYQEIDESISFSYLGEYFDLI